MLKAAAVGTAAICAGKLPAAQIEPVPFRGYGRRGGIYAVPILAVSPGVTDKDLDKICERFFAGRFLDEVVPLGVPEVEDFKIGEVTTIFRDGRYLLANFENLGQYYTEVCMRLGILSGGLDNWPHYRRLVSTEVCVSPLKLRRVVLLHPSDRPLWR